MDTFEIISDNPRRRAKIEDFWSVQFIAGPEGRLSSLLLGSWRDRAEGKSQRLYITNKDIMILCGCTLNLGHLFVNFVGGVSSLFRFGSIFIDSHYAYLPRGEPRLKLNYSTGMVELDGEFQEVEQNDKNS